MTTERLTAARCEGARPLRRPGRRFASTAALAALLLGACGVDPVRSVIADLESGEPVRQRAAIKRCFELREQAADAIPALVGVFVQSSDLRSDAKVALQNMGPRVFPAVKELATHADPKVRYQVVALIGNSVSKKGIGYEESWPILSTASQDSDAEVRGVAIAGLGTYYSDTERAVPLISAGLEDPSPLVRAQSAATLGKLGPAARPSLPGLVRALFDEDYEVRSNAGRSLRMLPLEPDIGPLLPLRHLTREEASARLRTMRASPIEGALKIAYSRDDLACLLLLLRAGQKPEEGLVRIAQSAPMRPPNPIDKLLREAILEAATAPQ